MYGLHLVTGQPFFKSTSMHPLILFLSTSRVNSLGPSDVIWRQRSGSTSAQVMACCLTAPSHYLNQCWLIISKVKWHSSKGKFTRDTSAVFNLGFWNWVPGTHRLCKKWVPSKFFESLSDSIWFKILKLWVPRTQQTWESWILSDFIAYFADGDWVKLNTASAINHWNYLEN